MPCCIPFFVQGSLQYQPKQCAIQGKSLNIIINLALCKIPSKMGPLLYDPCVFSLVSIVPLVPLENLAIDQHDLQATDDWCTGIYF